MIVSKERKIFIKQGTTSQNLCERRGHTPQGGQRHSYIPRSPAAVNGKYGPIKVRLFYNLRQLVPVKLTSRLIQAASPSMPIWRSLRTPANQDPQPTVCANKYQSSALTLFENGVNKTRVQRQQIA